MSQYKFELHLQDNSLNLTTSDKATVFSLYRIEEDGWLNLIDDFDHQYGALNFAKNELKAKDYPLNLIKFVSAP